MKGLLALAVVMMLGLSVYNTYQIRTLRQEVDRLDSQVKQAQAGGVSDLALQRAMDLMVQARVAVANTDWSKARNAYESARQQLSTAASSAGQKAGPALRWLQDQAREIGSQIQNRVPESR